jgi:hypothetical protein
MRNEEGIFMNQNKRFSRKLLVISAFVAIAAVLAVAAYAFQPASTHGSVTINGPFYDEGMVEAQTDLLARIAVAENLLATTDSATAGIPNSPNTHWATPAAHTTLRNAIAQARVNGAVFAPGDTFQITANIEGNTGFSGMMIRIGLPPQLEIIAVTPSAAFGGPEFPNFQGGVGWDSATKAVNPPLTGNATVSGWGGGTNTTYTTDGAFLTYTVRVRTGAAAGVTAPITVSFYNSVTGYEFPSDINSNPLTMSLQGTPISTLGQVINVGGVRIIN